MKKIYTLFVLILVFLSACGPAKIEPIEEIEPNETAFVVPLEGETKAGQAKFMSIDYLSQAKISTKRVVIPVRYRSTGRGWTMYQYIPTVKVIRVDRTPVTREWTKGKNSGTNKTEEAVYRFAHQEQLLLRNEAIAVESLDSIGFSVGVNITCGILEEDAATFLYYYAGKPLMHIIDENVRGYVQSILGERFGELDLELCKKQKAKIFKELAKDATEHFKAFGITINNIGHSEGLLYDDVVIQKKINDKVIAEMDIQVAHNEKLAQDERNKLLVAKAEAEKLAAIEFSKAQEAMIAKTKLEIELIKAQATKIASQRWNGATPAQILPQGSSLLFGLDK